MEHEVVSSRRNQDGKLKALKGGWKNNATDGELQRWLDSVDRLVQAPEDRAEWAASLKARRQVDAELNRRRAARRRGDK
jgi:hypothetical protein